MVGEERMGVGPAKFLTECGELKPLLTRFSRGELEGAALLRALLSISWRSSHGELSFLAGSGQQISLKWSLQEWG